MPIFDYKCNKCGHCIELISKGEELDFPCIECIKVMNDYIKDKQPEEIDLDIVDELSKFGTLEKQLSAPGGFEFNGLGCYHTEKHRR